MSKKRKLSLIRRLSQLGTLLDTCLHGSLVGEDSFGNRYYKAKKIAKKGARERRWVIYVDEPEASLVPPEWHGWLHHTLAAPLPQSSAFHKDWQKPHEPNATGTPEAYFPPGHFYKGGTRAPATGDYQAWKPE